MTTALSLRATHLSSGIFPTDPEFPFSRIEEKDNRLQGLIRVAATAMAIRKHNIVFQRASSLYINGEHFREIFIPARREGIMIRISVLTETGLPKPRSAKVHQLNKGDTLVFSVFDEISSMAVIQFMRVTGRGLALSNEQAVPFINIEPCINVRDTQDGTDIVTCCDPDQIHITTPQLYGIIWGILGGFNPNTTFPTIEQHLTAEDETFTWTERFGDTAPAFHEEHSAISVLSTLRDIFVNRAKVLSTQRGSSPAIQVGIHIEAPVGDAKACLYVATLPTLGVNAPSGVLSVPMTSAECTYLEALEPDLKKAVSIEPKSGDGIERIPFHVFTLTY